MPLNVLIGGFHPVNGTKARVTRYEVASGYASAIARGDAVTVVTAGTAELISAGGADLVAGVVRDVSFVSSGLREEDTYVAASTTYSPTARGSRNATYVYVWTDPNMEFWVNVATHANTDTEAKIRAAVGAGMDVTVGTSDSLYRQSAMVLDGDPAATAKRCQILEVVRVPAQDNSGVANWRARVIFKEHMFANTTASI